MNGAQITLAVLYVIGLMVHAHAHGRPRDGEHSVVSALIRFAVVNSILYWGGFWDMSK